MTTINIRIEEELKNEAGAILKDLGMDISSAVKVFLKQVVSLGALPFQPTTRSAYRLEIEAEIAEALKGPGYKNADEMFRAILDKDTYDNWK
jgi:DNA-damage-inducible protein J